MAWIEVVRETAGGALREAYRAVGGAAADAARRVANILAIHSLNPPSMGDHHALYRTLMFGDSPLSRAEREAIAVVVSSVNGCRY